MRALVFSLALIGCAEWPNPPGTPPLRDTGAWPKLVPAGEIHAAMPAARPAEAQSLAARARALRARAAILRRAAGTSEEMEALRARLPR